MSGQFRALTKIHTHTPGGARRVIVPPLFYSLRLYNNSNINKYILYHNDMIGGGGGFSLVRFFTSSFTFFELLD